MKVLPSFCASQTGTRREPDRGGVNGIKLRKSRITHSVV